MAFASPVVDGHHARVSEAAITDSIVVEAPIDVVWSVITEPAVVPVLDPRLTLVSTTGAAGTSGSGYVLRMSRGSQTLDMTYAVVEATPKTSLSLTVRMGRREPSMQSASLEPHPYGVVLTWTTRMPVPWGLAALGRRFMRREMGEWLNAIAAEAERRA